VLESVSAATDLDLISYLKAIPDARMLRGVRFPAWYLLLVAVLSHSHAANRRSQSAAADRLSVDLSRYAGGDARHHATAKDVTATTEISHLLRF